MNIIKIVGGFLAFYAVLYVTALLANGAIWLTGILSPFFVPAILIGFVPTVVYLVHRVAKATL